MITISGPDKFHSAYSPILFKVQENDLSVTVKEYSLMVTFNKNKKTETVDLVRPMIGDQIGTSGEPGAPFVLPHAIFDLSGVVRNFFDEQAPAMANDVEVDKRLYAKYTCAGQSYIALNAVPEAGAPGSCMRYRECVLSALPVLRRYEGYDFDVSLLCGDGAAAPLVPNAVNRVKPDALPINYLQDEAGNFVIDECGNYIVVNGVNIVDAPVPRNPFYIRWINRLGGVDYWMFGNAQEITLGVKEAKTLLSYPTASARTLDVEAENTVVVGASGISKREWDVLSLLPLSPQIEWYNEKTEKWLAITVGKSENSINTNRTLHDVEFTFNLPALQTQFA